MTSSLGIEVVAIARASIEDEPLAPLRCGVVEPIAQIGLAFAHIQWLKASAFD